MKSLSTMITFNFNSFTIQHRPKGSYYYIKYDNQTVAYFRTNEGYFTKEEFFVAYLTVLKRWRKKGGFIILMHFIKEIAKQEGFKRVTLITVPYLNEDGTMGKTTKLYIDYGFEVVDHEIEGYLSYGLENDNNV